MDRLVEWRLFVAVASLRSFGRAARSLGRAPQASTRALAAIEERLGTRLVNRTTRAVSLTDDGERYLARARRALAELDALEAVGDADAPLAGRLTLTAPVLFGRLHVMPVVAEFLARHRALEVNVVLLDRVVALAEEGIDLGVRIGALPDSALRARVIGQVRSVVCASPAYLARAGTPRRPEALARHDCIALTATTPVPERWSFALRGARAGSFARPGARERGVAVRPRLLVNTAEAAVDAAVAGLGLVRVLSYQVAAQVAARRLRIVLAAYERAPLPVHLVHLPGPQPRAAVAFADFAHARIRARMNAGLRAPRA